MRMRLLGGGFALFAVACGGSTGPAAPTYVVSYVLSGDPLLRCDSVEYEDAQGGTVSVPSPALPWRTSFAAQAGHHIQVTAWVVASGSGQSGKLKMSWTISGTSSVSDSSQGTSTAPGAFALSVARQL